MVLGTVICLPRQQQTHMFRRADGFDRIPCLLYTCTRTSRQWRCHTMQHLMCFLLQIGPAWIGHRTPAAQAYIVPRR
jgi:hypothetical protein